jgi:GNAT superfamily N-acetyltransferase
MASKLEMKFVPFSEWRRDIAPLWSMEGADRFIAPTIDGFGQMQFAGKEKFSKVLVYPITAELDGERVGWTSIYNISNEAVRVRGIYVLPHHRSSGIGYAMVKYAASLWPLPWKHCYMFAREGNIQRYLKWGFTIAPQHKLRSWEDPRVMNLPDIVLMRRPIHEIKQ